MDKQILLHIGSPKTGTTAIQGFLKGNPDVLADAGVNYVSAGRANIAHNSVPKLFRSGEAQAVCDAIAHEIDTSDAHIHVISSELFFLPNNMKLVAKMFAAHLPKPLLQATKVVCYLRRQDRYLEALYKQYVKNGKIPADPDGFYRAQFNKLSYSPTLAVFADKFGQENVIVRPFERSALRNGDAVEDFIYQCEAPIPTDILRAAKPTSNKTFSVEVTEILGLVSRHTGLNTRQMIRSMTRMDDAAIVRSNDVFDHAARRAIVEHHSADNDAVRAMYCSDREALFKVDDLEGAEAEQLTTEQVRENWQAAIRAMARAIGEQVK